MRAACNQPRDMRHIGQKVSADFIRNFPESRPVPAPRISGAAADDQLWFVFSGDARDFVHVDPVVITTNAISDWIKPFARHVNRRSMGQMPACVEI